MEKSLAAIKTINPAHHSIPSADWAAGHNAPTRLRAGGAARPGSAHARHGTRRRAHQRAVRQTRRHPAPFAHRAESARDFM